MAFNSASVTTNCANGLKKNLTYQEPLIIAYIVNDVYVPSDAFFVKMIVRDIFAVVVPIQGTVGKMSYCSVEAG